MTKHIGVKLINAFPMTRQAYNDFRGWQLPADENGADEGYLVEYLDGGKPNTDRFDGYVSWSPKEVFEKAYRSVSGLSFGLAIEALKQGKKVSRAGWNGKGLWVQMVPQKVIPCICHIWSWCIRFRAMVACRTRMAHSFRGRRVRPMFWPKTGKSFNYQQPFKFRGKTNE